MSNNNQQLTSRCSAYVCELIKFETGTCGNFRNGEYNFTTYIKHFSKSFGLLPFCNYFFTHNKYSRDDEDRRIHFRYCIISYYLLYIFICLYQNKKPKKRAAI